MSSRLGVLIPYKRDWAVIGNCCVHKSRWEDGVPIYYVNIGPLYSQHCIICDAELVHGTSGVELFGNRERFDALAPVPSIPPSAIPTGSVLDRPDVKAMVSSEPFAHAEPMPDFEVFNDDMDSPLAFLIVIGVWGA